jgi:putative intracellular protease/amidase
MKKKIKHGYFVFVLLLLTIFPTKISYSNDVKVLFILSNNCGANIYYTLDDMEKCGWQITKAALTQTVTPCSSFGGLPTITVDKLLTEITNIAEYDAIALMPASWRVGNAYADILASAYAKNLIKAASDSGLVVWALCGGTRVLAAANIINGKHVLGAAVYQSEYVNAGAIYLGDDHLPVIDGNIVTCVRDQFYHYKNAEALTTALENNPRYLQRIERINNSNFGNIPLNSVKGDIWTKTYGGPKADGCSKIIETSDGGFALAGYTFSFGNGKSDMFLVKTDSLGNTQWYKTYGGSGFEYAYSIGQTSDNGFLLAGYSTSTANNNKNIYVVKTNSSGELIWEKTYGKDSIDVASAIYKTTDGNYLICGHTQSYGAGEDDIYVLKINQNGDTLWTKTFGGTRTDIGNSILEVNSSNYIFAGSTGSPGITSNNQDFYIIKTNSSGTSLWAKNFGTSGSLPFDWCNDIKKTTDDGFMMVGETSFNSPLDIMMVKLDSAGGLGWKKFYGNNFYDYGNAICNTTEGGFLICGTTKSKTTQKNDIFVVKVDNNGTELWRENYGGDYNEWGSSVCRTRDGNYVIAGQTNSSGNGSFDIYVSKIKSTGPIGIKNISEELSLAKNYYISNYPNPFNSTTKIVYKLEKSEEVTIKIYDLLGKEIRVLENTFKPAGANQIIWNGKDCNGLEMPSGIYFVKLKTERAELTKKITLLK